MLVNSAGLGIGGRVEDMTAKQWDLQFGVNLRGLFLLTRGAIPLLRETRGHIVNLASIAGTLPTPGLAAYGATKAAVISFTRSLNAELDGDGVRALALCPAFVDTPMAAWAGIPGEEMIQPEDCAELVRAVLRLSPYARVPQIVVERVGSGDLPGLGLRLGRCRARSSSSAARGTKSPLPMRTPSSFPSWIRRRTVCGCTPSSSATSRTLAGLSRSRRAHA